MDTNFQISLNLRNIAGITTIGCFFLGPDQHFAEHTFKLLKGMGADAEKNLPCLELTCVTDDVRLPLALKPCTLDQLASNIQLLTKELFKYHALKDET
jgi:hypothetical protein